MTVIQGTVEKCCGERGVRNDPDSRALPVKPAHGSDEGIANPEKARE
jgi:hypothetical protein